MTELERAEAFFAKDKFATQLMGIGIDEVRDGYARCSLTIDERHLNADGAVMGGVYFTIADFVFAVASNLNQPPTVSLTCQIAFLSVPKGKRMIAEAKRIRAGYSTCYYNVEVTDELGTIVAEMAVTGFIKRPGGGKEKKSEA